MFGIIAAVVVAVAVNPVSNPGQMPAHLAKPAVIIQGLGGVIVIQGLGGPQEFVRKAGGTQHEYMRKAGGDPYNIADCRSYFAKVKMGNGSVRTTQLQPTGTLGRCSFSFSGPITRPVDLFIGFGADKQGWQIGHLHVSQTDTNDLTRLSVTYQKIMIENTIGSTSAQDDWMASTPKP
jgi:hypothetical protein